ncbi:hypothetical protein [Sphingomonas sp. HMP6]|uniref:hypothetical protein n=1 Tax=Sphingomonas sp. HMP6 TaxID=1517551 RepID=UPI0015966E27|nr:hypothetical protein [Sphingomonas sp. HMP6]BCA57689.1 hypothetical protein HMP06_0458 [Sphingomonas sp. HMP6]
MAVKPTHQKAAAVAAPAPAPAPAPAHATETLLAPETTPPAEVDLDTGPFIAADGFGQGNDAPVDPVTIDMTGKFDPALGFGHADDVLVEALPDPALMAQDGSMAPRDPALEADITRQLEEFNSEPIAMSHPDGGTSDQYDTNHAGHILVPATEAAAMSALGFVVVAD